MHLNNLCFILPSEVHDIDPPLDHHHDLDHQHHHKPSKKDRSCRHLCGGGHIFDSLHRFLESRWTRSSHHHHVSHKRQPSSIYHDTVGVHLTEKVGGGVARIFSYAELYIGSKGFSDDEILGSGGFGKVYRAVLPSDGTEVAVKCLVGRGERFEKSFMAELVAVAHLRHRNLVRLRGWCVHDDDQLLLVYDYMPNLSLDRLLFKRPENKGLVILDWGRRLKIVNGLAAALFYLHEQLETQIIHRDVKTSNIMLDSHYNARLGDFGLARWLEHEYEYQITSTPNKNHQFRLADTTRAGGTIGYLSPESFHSVATAKSDVFSFGIVVLEIVSGRRAVDLTFPDDQIILLDWIRRLSDDGMLLQAGDARLKDGSYRPSEMEQLIHIGLLCTLHDPKSRPNMKWVVEALSGSVYGKFPGLPSFKKHPLYISVSSSNTTMTTTTITTNANTTASNTISTTTASFPSNSSIFLTAKGETVYATAELGNGGDGNDGSDGNNGNDGNDGSDIKASQGVLGSSRTSLSCCSTDPFSMVDTAREMTYSEIIYATDNFSEANRVAEVDFASSYRGFLDNRYILVKRLHMKTCPALRGRFATELLNLGRLRQRNLMQLRGWCTEQGEMLVIYDYAANHRLLTHHLFLHNPRNESPVLQWKHRYNILKSLAYAIRYLHEEWDEQVIHRSITLSAVCIDPEMNPRLNSLALAEFLTRNEHGEHVAINKNDSVRGIFGYIAPEYMESGVATTKADVYSFGVVMLEMVTGEMAVDFRRPYVLLVQRVHEFEGRKSKYEKLADWRLDGVYNHKELVRMAKLGIACTRSDPDVRPSIRKIVSILDGYDKSFMEEGLRKEGMEEWKQKNASLLSLIKRGQALGIH